MKKLILSLALAAGVACAFTPAVQPVYANGGGYAGSSYKDYVSQYITLYLWGRSYYGYYEGEVNASGLPNGQGRFTSTTTDTKEPWIYEGSFRNGHLEGEGATTWPDDGYRREGYYTNDEINTHGRFIDLKRNKVLFDCQMLRDMPLYEECSMHRPVSYYKHQLTISDAYVDSRLGYTQARGQYVIVLVDMKNVSRERAGSLTGGKWLKLWDKTNDKVYDMDISTMKRYYGSYNDTAWINKNLEPGESTGEVAIVFDVDRNFDEDNCSFVIYGGFKFAAQPVKLDIR